MPRDFGTYILVAACLAFGGCSKPAKSSRAPHSDAAPVSSGLKVSGVGLASPIVAQTCVPCHSSKDSLSALDFSTTEAIQRNAVSMAEAVRSGRMPPWQVEKSCNLYQNNPSLSSDEQSRLLSWLDAGAPAEPTAKAQDLPVAKAAAPAFDMNLSMPVAYTPTAFPDDFRCFILRLPTVERRFVTAVQFSPDKKAMVHHVLTHAVAKADEAHYLGLEIDGPGHGYTCIGGVGGNHTMTTKAAMLATWVPGTPAQHMPEGEGFLLEPGQMLIVQIHYNTSSGKPEPDQSHIQLATLAATSRQAFAALFTDPTWVQPGGMVIPARARDSVFTTAIDLTKSMAESWTAGGLKSGQAFEIGRVGLHMHQRGTSGKLSLLRASGKEECLVDIPEWDFNWQEAYNLEHPVVVQPGDKLKLTCHFDNSGQPHLTTKHHDSDVIVPPAKTVEWGESTSDEMCMGLLLLSTPKTD